MEIFSNRAFDIPGGRAPLASKKSASARLRYLAALGTAAALLVPAFSVAAGADPGDAHEYVGVKKCKTCHKKEEIGDQYGTWLGTRHSKAYETLAGEKASEVAAGAGVADPQNDATCTKCHVTAHGAPAELVPASFKREDGVQCEACHGAGKDYRKKKVMMDHELAVSKGLVVPSEETCVTCHNDGSPTWDPGKYTRADGTKSGFDFEQAYDKIAHEIPEGYDAASSGSAD